MNPKCQHCSEPPVYLSSSARFYGGRDFGPVWYCEQCSARVSCHRGTRDPLGTCADVETRHARKAAHAAFDPLWKDGVERGFSNRIDAYAWLAEAMDLPPIAAHMGLFGEYQAWAVVMLCRDRVAP